MPVRLRKRLTYPVRSVGSDCPRKIALAPRLLYLCPKGKASTNFWSKDHPHKNFQLPGIAGNVCRKGLKFQEIPGNLYFQKTSEKHLKSGDFIKIRPILL